LNLGHALKALGQDDEARTCWRKALESNPELASSYFTSSLRAGRGAGAVGGWAATAAARA